MISRLSIPDVYRLVARRDVPRCPNYELPHAARVECENVYYRVTVMQFLTTAVLAAALAVPAAAQQIPVSSIRVTADARVSARPDRAQIDMGVSTHAPSSQQAANDNARQVDAVLAAVRKAAPQATLKTVNYSINPTYQFHPTGEPPTATGFDASNIVQVTIDELTQVSAVLDAAAQAGANQIRGVQFMLRDEQAARAEALRKAAAQARSEADVLAAALSLRVVRVLSVEEGVRAFPVARPMVTTAMQRSEGVATPVETGLVDVSADVTLTVEVLPLSGR
jgi:hypothetical protein